MRPNLYLRSGVPSRGILSVDRALNARAGDLSAQPVHLVPPYAAADPARLDGLVESYRRLADVFHDILAEQSLDALLERIADTLEDLIPHDSLTIYEADEPRRLLLPVLSRDQWAEKLLGHTLHFGEGITGWAAEHREAVLVNQAHLDPRVKFVPGTPVDEPEALLSIPLVARAQLKGALNIYRQGDATFNDEEFELAQALRRRGRARARQRADPRAARAPGADRLAHRPLQPPLLPRAPPLRAAPREPRRTTRSRC